MILELFQAAARASTQAPGGAFPSLAEVLSGGPLQGVATALGALGDILWAVAYVLIVRKAAADRTYGMPLAAACLNFTWEFWLTLVAPPAAGVARIAHALWLLIDCAIVWQLFKYGREEQRIPIVRKHFVPVLLACMLAALAGQVTLREFLVGDQVFPDINANGIAYFDNLVMALMFVLMYFERPAMRGLSIGAAWCMTIGTGIISIANVLVFNTGSDSRFELRFRELGSGKEWTHAERSSEMLDLNFFYFMFIGIVVLNAIYLILLHRAKNGHVVAIADGVSPARAAYESSHPAR